MFYIYHSSIVAAILKRKETHKETANADIKMLLLDDTQFSM